VFGIRDIHLLEQVAETTAIFGDIHIIKRGAYDRYPFLMQALSQLERGLSTELHDHPIGFFMLYDLPEMLPVHRLEVQLVGNIKISRNRFGITVDHDGLKATF